MSRDEFEDAEPYVVIEQHGARIGPFLAGLAAGAGLALLFAPRSGEETRRDIRRRASRVRRAAEDAVADVADGVAGTYHEARQRVEDQLDAARRAVDLKRRQVRRAMDAGRAAAQDAREELEARIAESKAAYAAAEPAPARRANTRHDADDL